MSRGRCQGKSPSRPITRLVLIATIALMIIVCYVLIAELQFVPADKGYEAYEGYKGDVFLLPEIIPCT